MGSWECSDGRRRCFDAFFHYWRSAMNEDERIIEEEMEELKHEIEAFNKGR